MQSDWSAIERASSVAINLSHNIVQQICEESSIPNVQTVMQCLLTKGPSS